MLAVAVRNQASGAAFEKGTIVSQVPISDCSIKLMSLGFFSAFLDRCDQWRNATNCSGQRFRPTFLKRDGPDSTSVWNSNAAILTSWA